MTIPNRQLGTIPSEVNGVFQVYFGVQIPNQQVFGSLVCFFFQKLDLELHKFIAI